VLMLENEQSISEQKGGAHFPETEIRRNLPIAFERDSGCASCCSPSPKLKGRNNPHLDFLSFLLRMRMRKL